VDGAALSDEARPNFSSTGFIETSARQNAFAAAGS
jgi:hypothetical protein